MDLFTDVTLFLFFIPNSKHHHSIYYAKVSKYVKFHKNLLQTHENMGPMRGMGGGAVLELALVYVSL